MSNINFATVVTVHDEKEGQSGLPVYQCASPSCTSGLWTVEILSAHDQLWRVCSASDGSYRIAGLTPACPWCGGDLMVATTLADLPGEYVESKSQWN
ncbi:MAG: hypothetical protein U0175_18665 [Caldilineaceae bacterium]